jgi:hypothetical protein
MINVILHIVGYILRFLGFASFSVGVLGSSWLCWNLGSFWLSRPRHGDSHWGVVAALFYAAPCSVLLLAGAGLLLLGRLL